jgi:glutamate synthase (NADPH) large chain
MSWQSRTMRTAPCAGAGASALQHQHLPVVAAGAPVPLRRAQRRDQHAARQHQLDARARGAAAPRELLGDDLAKILPGHRPGGSDSATFDNVLELLVMAGRSLPHAVLMMIPEAWERQPRAMDDGAKRAFYEYHSCLMEPWDGPASIAFTDGTLIGAVLDRNGLRPSRYCHQGRPVVMASEVGVLDIPPRSSLKGGCSPASMFLVDTAEGRIVDDEEIKHRPGRERNPTASGWRAPRATSRTCRARAEPPDHQTVLHAPAGVRLHAGGPALLMAPMARERRGADRLDGHDTRWPCSRTGRAALRLLQAALRAGHQPAARRHPRGAGDLDGDDARAPRATCSRPTPEHCRQIKLNYPILTTTSWRSSATCRPAPGFRSTTLPTALPRAGRGAGARAALERCARRRAAAIAAGYGILILSDRGVDATTRRSRACWPRPACTTTWSARARARAAGWSSRRRAARGAPLRAAARLRRRRGQPVPGLRDLHDMIRQGLLPGVDHDDRPSSTTSRRSTRACSR